MPVPTFAIGDSVKVKGTDHVTKVSGRVGYWYVLEEKVPSHCCNKYGFWELEKSDTSSNNNAICQPATKVSNS